MANTERRIEGFGVFFYDQAVYDELMRLSKADLVELELDGTIYRRTAVRGLKKADLAMLVAHRETARREWDAAKDQSVNEAISLPITETDVSAAEVIGVLQFGKRLVWATLVSVVNRRTRFAPAFLVTVEFEGVRRLVRADMFLAA
jgi:nucleoside diphosphate kinase